MAADIDPVVRRLQPAQYLALDRGMADHVKQLAMAPHIAFQRRDVEIADQEDFLGRGSFGQFASKQIHFPVPDLPMPGMEVDDVYPKTPRFA